MKTQLFYQNRILSKEGMMIDTMYYVTTDWMDLYFFKFLWTDWTIQFLWLLFQLYLNRRYTRYSRKADEKWVGLACSLFDFSYFSFVVYSICFRFYYYYHSYWLIVMFPSYKNHIKILPLLLLWLAVTNTLVLTSDTKYLDRWTIYHHVITKKRET